MGAQFSRRVTMPPPVAMTVPEARPAWHRARCSRARKASSPSRANSSGMGQPAAWTTRASVSTSVRPSRWARARPTVVLPQPGIPMRSRFRVSRSIWAVISSTRPSGMAVSKKRSAAALAWATSIPSPLARHSSRSSAWRSSRVRAGL